EERYRRIAENAPDMIYRYRLGPNRGFEYVSPVAATLTGYPLSWFFEHDPFANYSLLHPEDRAQLEDFEEPNLHRATLEVRWVRK
ncbi:MAG: PAS domain-containing protein, partial [Actinomycetota bacterium]